MVNVPGPPKKTGPKWFGSGNSEARNWTDETALRGQRNLNDLIWLKCYGWVVVFLMVLFALLFVGSLSAWAWHYLTPVKWHWLSADQLSKVQSVIFSGSLGGIVSLVAQKQLSK